MTISEFFAQHQVQSIDRWATKAGSKIPFVLVAKTPKGELSCIPSVKGYNQSEPTFVYPTEVDDIDTATGEVKGKKTLYVFSNNEGKKPDAVLTLADFK